MYAHIEGLVAEKSADGLVLDCGGVGYLLSVSGNTLAAAPAVGGRTAPPPAPRRGYSRLP